MKVSRSGSRLARSRTRNLNSAAYGAALCSHFVHADLVHLHGADRASYAHFWPPLPRDRAERAAADYFDSLLSNRPPLKLSRMQR